MHDKIISVCTGGAVGGFVLSLAQVQQWLQIIALVFSVILGFIGVCAWVYKAQRRAREWFRG